MTEGRQGPTFLQTDPIRYGDGPNIYAYVHGDPANGTDPSGTAGPCGQDRLWCGDSGMGIFTTTVFNVGSVGDGGPPQNVISVGNGVSYGCSGFTYGNASTGAYGQGDCGYFAASGPSSFTTTSGFGGAALGSDLSGGGLTAAAWTFRTFGDNATIGNPNKYFPLGRINTGIETADYTKPYTDIDYLVELNHGGTTLSDKPTEDVINNRVPGWEHYISASGLDIIRNVATRIELRRGTNPDGTANIRIDIPAYLLISPGASNQLPETVHYNFVH